MAQNENNKQDKKVDGSEEIIKRLDAADTEGDIEEVLEITGEDSSLSDKDIDQLFQEDSTLQDRSIDELFEEDRKNLHKDLQDEVQKALIQPTMSKASLYRMRTKEPSEDALKVEIAQMKTVEEVWDESAADTDKPKNKKSILAMSVVIALVASAGSWALWKSTRDERGNEENIIAEEKKHIEDELKKQLVEQEIRDIVDLMNQYFSAISVDQKCETIYNADSIKAEITKYYEEGGGLISDSNFFIEQVLPVIINGEEIWEVNVANADYPDENIRKFHVRKNSANEFKVDWVEAVGLQSNDVMAFKKNRSKISTEIKFEVFPLLKNATYNWGFTESEYAAYRLIVPNSDLVFWGYAKKNTPINRKIRNSLLKNSRDPLEKQDVKNQFILSVRFLEDSLPENDQYILIDDIVSRKWISIDK